MSILHHEVYSTSSCKTGGILMAVHMLEAPPQAMPALPITDDDRAFFVALGERMTQFRKARGITQVQMAATLGVSQQTYQSYEVGRRRIQVSALPVVARALSVSLEDLFGASDSSPRKRGRSKSKPSRSCPRPSSNSSLKCSTRCSLKRSAKPLPSRLTHHPRSRWGLGVLFFFSLNPSLSRPV